MSTNISAAEHSSHIFLKRMREEVGFLQHRNVRILLGFVICEVPEGHFRSDKAITSRVGLSIISKLGIFLGTLSMGYVTITTTEISFKTSNAMAMANLRATINSYAAARNDDV